MGNKKDARIAVGVDGADEAADALGKMFKPFEEAAAKSASGLLDVSRLAGVAMQAFSGLKDAAVSYYSVDFTANAQKFTAFQREANRSAVLFGKDVEQMKAGFALLSRATGIPDEALAKMSKSFAVATRDASDNTDVLKAVAGESLLTGKSMDELLGVAATMHNSFGVALKDIPGAFESIRGTAEALGTVGGPAALAERFSALGETANHVAVTTKKDLDSLVAFTALVGKNLKPEAQKAVQQRLAGFLTTDTEPLRRQLHMTHDQMYDKEGNVKDVMGLAFRLQQDAIKRNGGDRQTAMRIMSQENNLGPQAAAALFNLTQADVDRARAAKPSPKAVKTLAAFEENPEEKQNRVKEDRNRLARDVVGRGVAAMDRGGTFENLPGIGGFGLQFLMHTPLVNPEFIAGAMLDGGAFDPDEAQKAAKPVKAAPDQQAGRARAILRAVERGGGEGAEGVERELGKATLGAVRSDPQLSALLSQLEQGQTQLDGLSDVIANAVREGLKGSPLEAKITVSDGTPDAATRAYSVTQVKQ